MLLTSETLAGIERGEVTLVFRRWRRPTVKAGGTLLTAVGQVSIEAVDEVRLDDVTQAEATAAGFPDLDSLRALLLQRSDGAFYRVRVSLLGPDPRIELRARIPEGKDRDDLDRRLARLDASGTEPWVQRVLAVIDRSPEVRAGDLATDLAMERADFKKRVRKLKGLGLTESLTVGYRISPRGRAVLDRMRVNAQREGTT